MMREEAFSNQCSVFSRLLLPISDLPSPIP